MQLKLLITAMRRHFDRWFHRRNIIIVSPHKVKHLSLGPLAQCCALAFALVCLSWASYSTGSYFAARQALKAQGQTLRSVVIGRTDSINPLLRLAPPITGQTAEEDTQEPMYTLSALNENKMAAKMALLEQQLADLKNANKEIVERVRDKTAGRIDDLESIIRSTGLNPQTLKKQYSQSKPKGKGQGGPYIPDDLSKLVPEAGEMFIALDQMALLGSIIQTLPLATPIQNASEESPFGHRADPFTGRLAFHSGIDLAGPEGAKIRATANGKIVDAGRSGAYGNAVDIDHGLGIVTRYGHLSQILVQAGQQVKKGDIIGIQGSTGRSTGNHLHYEVRYRDNAMNPKNFMKAGAHVVEE